jgi:hypothetical protein
MVGRVSALPSISEGGLSETQSAHSTPSVTQFSVALSSASGSLTACNAQSSNTTNHKVCFMVVVISFSFICPKFLILFVVLTHH